MKLRRVVFAPFLLFGWLSLAMTDGVFWLFDRMVDFIEWLEDGRE